MAVCYVKTATGASHLKNGRPCQDHSSAYRDGERAIVTACDGHGGALYVRSERGSRFASFALTGALLQTDKFAFRKSIDTIADALRVRILSEWNRLVEADLNTHPLRAAEMTALTEAQKELLKKDPFKAYGTTMHGAMLFRNRIICVSIGDGGFFLIRGREIAPLFPEDEEQVANLTHSLCEEDAGRYIRIAICAAGRSDGVLLCTDGVINPYGSVENFERSFAAPALAKLARGETDALSGFVEDLGREIGTGDDVSLAVLLRERSLKKYRKGEKE